MPSRSKLSHERRFVTHDLECVRPARRDRNFAPSLHDPRLTEAFTDAERATVYEEPLLLTEMSVKRPSVPAAACADLRSQKVPIRFEHDRSQIVRGTLENVAGNDASWVARRTGHRSRKPYAAATDMAGAARWPSPKKTKPGEVVMVAASAAAGLRRVMQASRGGN